jgi:hypothetical protein
MESDTGWGFMAWRGTLLGHFNSLFMPDPENISRDSATFLTLWSPGQYLIPGMISLSGVPLGVAIALTATSSLLLSLLGWIKLFKEYYPDSRIVIFGVLSIAAFRYSTLPFGIYNGGEILLQAATPWIVLGAFKVPYLSAVSAGLLAAALVFIAFLTKITGLIVAGSALMAGGVVALRRLRRVEPGTLGGAFGALVVAGAVWALFLSHGETQLSGGALSGGSTPESGLHWSILLPGALFSVVAPWVAGISWRDLLAWILWHPGRELIQQSGSVLALLMLPPAVSVASLVVLWQPNTAKESDLRILAFLYYGITIMIFVSLYYQAANIGYEERHFRSVGTLFFVGALIGAMGPNIPSWIKNIFLVLVGFLALYGLVSFSSRALAAADGHAVDRLSWTNQPIVDQSAIRYLQREYSHEGREALFVIPSSDIVVTMPLDARIILFEIDGARESRIATLRYKGRVPGHIYLLLQNRIADSAKGEALIRAFVDYNPQSWRRKTFSTSSVFVQ